MPMDLPTLRKLLSLDPGDPLSRFALGKKLFEEGTSPEELAEAASHLLIANRNAPEHLATYHILAQVLIKLGRTDEAREILKSGIARASAVGEGMGRDLAPAMQAMLNSI